MGGAWPTAVVVGIMAGARLIIMIIKYSVSFTYFSKGAILRCYPSEWLMYVFGRGFKGATDLQWGQMFPLAP